MSARRAQAIELVATGALSPLLLPIAWLVRRHFGLASSELAVGFLTFHAASLVNDPHFAVTYLLFYRDARKRAFGDAFPPMQRARYAAAGIVTPIALAVALGFGVSRLDSHAIGLVVQLMFLLVGWHYVKQGFGVLMVLSARRGAAWSPIERGAIYAHALGAWAYAFANPRDVGRELEEKGVVYQSIAQPAFLEPLALVIFVATGLVAAALVLRKVLKNRHSVPIGPLAAFVATLWLWTVYSAIDPLVAYLIPALHSIQYFFFVGLLAGNRARAEEGPPTFGLPATVRVGLLALSAIVVGWVILRGAPALLDDALVPHSSRFPEATTALGSTPFLAAFSVFVNVHHYAMDAVLWRRENPETRYLRRVLRARDAFLSR